MQADTIQFSKTFTTSVVNGKPSNVAVQAGDIVFKHDSGVTQFEMAQPKAKEEVFVLDFADPFHCSFRPSKFGQTQANLNPTNLGGVEEACVDIVEIAVATPKEKAYSVVVKPFVWGSEKDAMTVTWPFARGKKALKHVPIKVNGVRRSFAPDEVIDLLESIYKIKQVVTKHSWYALRNADAPGAITLTHRFEVQELILVEDVKGQ